MDMLIVLVIVAIGFLVIMSVARFCAGFFVFKTTFGVHPYIGDTYKIQMSFQKLILSKEITREELSEVVNLLTYFGYNQVITDVWFNNLHYQKRI